MRSAAPALALALAALELACWKRLVVEVAGQPVAVNSCARECPRNGQTFPANFWTRLQSYEKVTCRTETFVIFITKGNKVFCGDLEDSMVQSFMSKLDAMNAPPSSNAGTSMSEKPAVFHKFRGDATPTKAPAGTLGGPPGTLITATLPVIRTGHPNPSIVSSVSAGSDLENSPSKPAPSISGSTLQHETVPNESVVPKITEDPKTFGKGLTSAREGLGETTQDLMASPTSIRTLETSGFSPGIPMTSPAPSTFHPSSSSSSSQLITDFMGKGTEPSTTSVRLLPSSSGQSSAPSSSGTDSGPQSTVGLITGQSSTPCRADGCKTSSVNMKDRSGTTRDPAIALQDAAESRGTFPKSAATSPASAFRWQNMIETSTTQGVVNTSEVALTFLPAVLVGDRTHSIVLMSLAGAVGITAAVLSWAYAKYHFFQGASSKTMVQGFLYSPVDEYAMEML